MLKEWVSDHTIFTKNPLYKSKLEEAIRTLEPPFEIIDLHGGKGLWNHNGMTVEGLSLISLDVLNERCNGEWQYTVLEKNFKTYRELHKNIRIKCKNGGVIPSNIEVLRANSSNGIVDEIFDKSNVNGIIVADPCIKHDYWDNLSILSKKRKNMDIFLHFSAADRKRPGYFNDIPIEIVNKKYCFLYMDTKYNKYKQWVFLYFCNKKNHVPTYEHFYPLESEQGQEILYKINNTAA